MAFLSFLKPIEHDVGKAATGTLNFLKPVGQAAVGLAKTAGKVGGLGVEDVRAAGGLITGNDAATQAALTRGRSDINTAIGAVQSIPRGFAQLGQTITGTPTTTPTTPFEKALYGNQPISSLPQNFKQVKAQTKSGAEAAGSTVLSFLGDVAPAAGVAKLAKAPIQEGISNLTPLNEIGSIGKNTPAASDIHIPVGNTGTLRVSAQVFNDLTKATDISTVKNIIGKDLPQNIVDRVAPAIARTNTPSVIGNILSRSLSPAHEASPPLVPTPVSDVARPAGQGSLAEATVPKPVEQPPNNPDIQAAVDRATKPVNTGTFNYDPSAKNFKNTAGEVRAAYSGEKNAQEQAAAVLADTLKKAAPDEQGAVYWYRDQGGNIDKLKQLLNNPDPKLDPYRQDIQGAINLSPEGKQVSAALDQVYERAGKNAYDQGTLNSVLNDYGNTRLYKQEDQPVNIGSTLRQTANATKSRVFPTAAEAVLKGGKELATTNASDVAAVHLSDLARANTTNNLYKNIVDSGLGKALHTDEEAPSGYKAMGSLRALARDEKSQRINLYSKAGDLRPIQTKAERLVVTRQSWVRKLTSAIDKLNKQGLNVALSKTNQSAETRNAFRYLNKDIVTNAETTANTRGLKNIGAAQSVTGQLRSAILPSGGASIKETRGLINDLVNLPSNKIEAIKSKIATRENKLGPILDEISNLRDKIDTVKTERQTIIQQARDINSPTRIAVPADLAKRLGAITDPNLLNKVDGVRKIAAYQGLVKTVDLSLSLFHAITFAFQAATNTKFGYEILKNGTQFLNKINTPEFANNENFFAQAGGMTTKAGELQDITRNLSSTGTQSILGKVQDFPVAKQFLQLTDKVTSALFDKGQRWLKVTDFTNKFENYASKHPEATVEDLTKAARGYAKEVNATYGGLNWEAMGISKTQQGMLRFALLAPDWVISNISLGKYTVSDTGVAGKAARAQLFNALSTGMVTTQIMNKAITGHYTNENPKGHEFDVQIAPNVYITLFRGGPGELVKAFQDIQNKGFGQGVAGYFQGKASPLARTAIGFGSGTQFTGQPISKPGGNLLSKTKDEAAFLAQSALPIPFGVSGGLKYANNAKTTKQPFNPLVAASLGTGVSRFSKTNNNLSNREQAVLSQLSKQGAPKEEINAVTSFYLTAKAGASGRGKVSTAIDQALANGDQNKARQLANDYNNKYAQAFKTWIKKYGTYSNPGLEKAYNSHKINLSPTAIENRINSIKSNPLYSATTGG